jgi:predicted AlkP superfamily pyrophosphatase or phosphodiesterase
MEPSDELPLLPPPAQPLDLERQQQTRPTLRYWILGLLGLLVATVLTLGLLSFFSSKEDLLILISLDGTRPEYLNRNLTPTLRELSDHGIHGDMIPTFPSITFPNHYTLVTGLYPAYHGIVGNSFRDPKDGVVFTYTSKYRNPEERWWLGEPVWTRLVKQGLKTGTCFWPGSEAPHDGVYSTYYHKYDNKISLDQKLKWVFGWMDLPQSQRPRLITLYIPDIDHTGHESGPDSKELNDTLINVDYHLGKLVKGIKERKMDSHTSIVVVSDHGMAPTSIQKVLFMDDYVPLQLFDFIVNGPVLFIYPKDSKDLEHVYQGFKIGSDKTGLFDTWKKEDLPEEYFFQSDRVSPIVIMANMGYSFATRYNWNPERPPFPKGGAHGYNISDPLMHAIYIANGPRVKKGRLPLFRNTEVYQTLGKLMGFQWEPRNGTREFMNVFETFLT